MTPAALYLFLTALIFAVFGLAGLVAPGPMVAALGVTLAPEAVIVELRAVYGGASLGLAALFVHCIAPARQRVGVVAVALVIGGTLAGRLLGLLWEPLPPGFAWIAGSEAVWLVLALGLLPRTPGPV